MPYIRKQSYVSLISICMLVGAYTNLYSAEPSILVGPKTRVFDLAYSTDGERLAAAYEDGSFRIWDPKTCQAIVTQTSAHENHCRSIAWGLDGESLWTSGDEGSIRGWNSGTGHSRSLAIPIEKPYDVVVCPSPEQLAIASRDGSIYLLQVNDIPNVAQKLKGHEGPVRYLAVSSDGSRLASVGHDHVLKVWDLQTHRCLHTSPGIGNGRLFAVAFSDSNKFISFAGDSGRIHILDQETRELKLNWKGHEREIRSLAFSKDSKWLASVGEDVEARVWNAINGSLHQSLSGQLSKAYCVAFSPIENTIAIGRSDGSVEIWRNATPPLTITDVNTSP